MDFQKLLQNKTLLISIIAGVVLVIVGIVAISTMSGNKSTGPVVVQEKTIKEPFILLNTNSAGKALEIQALLARESIVIHKNTDGSKIKLSLKNYKPSERDRAILAVVKSGLMDRNIGLEIFDKGDFTSTKDDKRIRLARAINGEISRLIKKIPPIENASVFISIPEPTIFSSMKKPTTATVQVTLPSGTKIDKEKVKAIINLLIGSVQGLDASHITITDTNGNVYSSMLSPEDDMLSMIEEKDKYMKQKVQAQLDRLIGKGNYVVTISTYLREIPIEKSSVYYDPEKKSVISEQKFSENLGDNSSDKGEVTSGASSYVPKSLPQVSTSKQNRNYVRSAEELQYGVSKTQVTEFRKAGMIEEISIALTIEQGSLPANMKTDELKELVARSASPKARAENVQIAFSNSITPYLASERPIKLPEPEQSGNPWWTVAVLLGIGLIFGLVFIAGRAKTAANKHQKELHALKKQTVAQESQLKEISETALTLMSQQEQLQQAVINNKTAPSIGTLQDSISNLSDDIENDFSEEEIAEHMKSWIESSN